MFAARTLRTSAAVLAALLAAGTIGTAPAWRASRYPSRPASRPTVDAHPGGTYDVSASWDVSASATSYRVTLTKGGDHAGLEDRDHERLVPHRHRYAGHRHPERARRRRSQAREARDARGPARRRHGARRAPTRPTADNTPASATITQDSLSDNSGAGQVTRTVDWGDGSPDS